MTLNTPAPLPANLPKIAEYRDPITKLYRAIDTPIRTESRKNDYGRITEWTLSHRLAGYTGAGSCARLQERPIYRATHWLDNAIHGQSFLTLEEAEAYLAARGELVEVSQ